MSGPMLGARETVVHDIKTRSLSHGAYMQVYYLVPLCHHSHKKNMRGLAKFLAEIHI